MGGFMARVAVALSCTTEVVTELERLSRSRSGEVRMAERARIVLACLAGKRNDEVASEVGVRPNTVGQWRRRFAERGMAGLRDAPRPGKPAKYGVELRDRVLAQLELPPPASMASWDGGSLALALSVSDDAVWRVLRKEGIQLQRHRSWCVEPVRNFVCEA
jgi:transposase